MTRGIGFQPNVQLTFTAPKTREQVQPIAPVQVEDHLKMLSEKELKATFGEALKRAWLAVVKWADGGLFNTKAYGKELEIKLANDVLTRLNSVTVTFPDGEMEGLGDMVRRWLEEKRIELSFDDNFKNQIDVGAMQAIAKEVSTKYYQQYEDILLATVKERGFTVDKNNSTHQGMREFIKFYVNFAANKGEAKERTSFQLDELLQNIAVIFSTLNRKITDELTSAEFRGSILNSIEGNINFEQIGCLRESEDLQIIVDTAVKSVNRRNAYVNPKALGNVARPAWLG